MYRVVLRKWRQYDKRHLEYGNGSCRQIGLLSLAAFHLRWGETVDPQQANKVETVYPYSTGVGVRAALNIWNIVDSRPFFLYVLLR